MEERRKRTRRVIDGEFATIPVVTVLRVLDMSVAGVLFQCSRPFSVGARGTLRLSLGGSLFVAEVCICRVSPVGNDRREYRIAGTFVTFGPEHRQLLERFTIA